MHNTAAYQILFMTAVLFSGWKLLFFAEWQLFSLQWHLLSGSMQVVLFSAWQLWCCCLAARTASYSALVAFCYHRNRCSAVWKLYLQKLQYITNLLILIWTERWPNQRVTSHTFKIQNNILFWKFPLRQQDERDGWDNPIFFTGATAAIVQQIIFFHVYQFFLMLIN